MAQQGLQYGQRTIRRILKELQHPTALEHQYAEAILAQAVRNAASRPTPQAPMAAENMTVEEASIVPLAGGAPEAVAIGSEFGSSQYAQFHRDPNPRGYWLYPAVNDQRVLADTDQELEKILDKIIAGVPV